MISIKNVVSLAGVLLIVFSVAVCFGADSTAAKSSNPVVVMETSMGDITVELYQDKAPKSVANFLEYVKSGFYNGTIFHRVIKGFMIQCGGYTEDNKSKSGKKAPIENEATNGLKNEVGTLAMARTTEINSATSEFFINTKNNASLNHRNDTDGFGYAVFGKVTGGMDVVYKIENTKELAMNEMGEKAKPVTPIVIKSVKLKGE